MPVSGVENTDQFPVGHTAYVWKSLVRARSGVTTLDGQRIDVDLDGGNVLLDGAQRLQAVNISASNGVVHVIDGVLMPGEAADSGDAM